MWRSRTAPGRSTRRRAILVSIRLSAARSERFAQKARTFEAVAPGKVHGLGQADARADRDLDLFVAMMQLERWGIERKAILRPRDAERLAQAAGARAQQAHVAHATPAAHCRDALERLDRADQHRTGAAFRLAHEVHAPVDAVGAIDVDVAGRAEHHGVALGATAITVPCGIGVVIGLDLDDAAADAMAQKDRADQIRRDRVHAAGKKTASDASHFGFKIVKKFSCPNIMFADARKGL